MADGYGRTVILLLRHDNPDDKLQTVDDEMKIVFERVRSSITRNKLCNNNDKNVR